MNLTPALSICITTYNVGPFIKQCLDSVFSQKTKEHFEVIVVDDCSSDETPHILQEYYKRFPEQLRLIFNDENLKSCRNSLKAWSLATGRFIAILDGDDFWTDEYKLEKQLDALEQHPEAVMCHHDGYIEKPDGSKTRFTHRKKAPVYNLDHLISDVNIWNSSVMYRNVLNGKYPKWMDQLIHHDHVLHVLHALHGSVIYLDEPMGVYRQHLTNVSLKWQGDQAAEFSRVAIYACHHLKEELPNKFHGELNLIAARHYDIIAGIHLRNKKWISFVQAILKGYLLCPVRSIKEYKDSYYHLFRQP